MAIDFGAVFTSILSVLGVGLLLGAGIPTVYALGIRSFESEKSGARPIGIVLMALCVLLAVGGIIMIIFGDAIFG